MRPAATTSSAVQYRWTLTPIWVFFFLLFVLKVGLGDTVVQHWSWWWITAPLWAPLVVAAVMWVLGSMICYAVDRLEK